MKEKNLVLDPFRDYLREDRNETDPGKVSLKIRVDH